MVGLAAGYLGGWVDRVLMFINDIFVAIPIFPILILFYFVHAGEPELRSPWRSSWPASAGRSMPA